MPYITKLVYSLGAYHVAVHHSLVLSSFQHVAVPVHQVLRLGNLLLSRAAMEDIVVSLSWGTCPNMDGAEPVRVQYYKCDTHTHTHTRARAHTCTHTHNPLPLFLHKLHVANDYLMVHYSPVLSRLEEMHTVKVGDVHTPGEEGGRRPHYNR